MNVKGKCIYIFCILYATFFILDESILVVGGDEDYLNPAVIYFNENGPTDFDRCQTGNYEKRAFAVGDFLDDKFVVCGGWGKNDVEKKDCQVIYETGSQSFDMSASGRSYASSIKLNQSTLWITGGYDSHLNDLNSTEFVTVNGTTFGVELPITVHGHCMVQYQSDTILLIGGKQNGEWDSDMTWIIDLKNGFDFTEGPSLKEGRMYHSCGTMEDEYGNVLVIVAGGDVWMEPVEVLNTTLMKEWVEG